MAESPAPGREAVVHSQEDLSAVHSFYLYLLEGSIGHEIPVPHQISHDKDALLHFVLLLDMAVTPQMIRNGFKVQEHRNAPGALLRFYARKPQRRREDRDKADVIATTLFRTMFSEHDATRDDNVEECILDFEVLLDRIYDDVAMEPPPNEHLQLVRRFEILRREVQTFQTFDELIESNVMQRVRAIKQTLHPSFLHPSILATIAHYNVCFHATFDRLFAQAAQDMRSFAARLHADGGHEELFSNPLSAIKSSDLLDEAALKRSPVRQFAKVRQTIESDLRAQRHLPKAVQTLELSGEPNPPETNGYNTPTSSVGAADAEDRELATVQQTIRSFVRTADANSARVVPLPNGSIELTQAEVEAFRADFGDERSFRADCAAALVSMACLDARLRAQLLDFEKTKNTAYNWKPHADGIAHLLSQARTLVTSSMDLAALAAKRGLQEKSETLYESIDKLRPNGRAAVEALQSINAAVEV